MAMHSTTRRQRATINTAFSSSSSLSSLLNRSIPLSSRSICSEIPCIAEDSPSHRMVPRSVVTTRVKRIPDPSPSLSSFGPPMAVIASPSKTPADAPKRTSRFTTPVPAPKPHEIMPRKRGRNSRRRAIEAEYFRRYLHLRRQLKPWSDAFIAKHGRTPALHDVCDANIPGLLDRFMEYLDARNRLRIE